MKFLIPLVVMLSLYTATNAHPIAAESSEDSEELVPILKPGPYDSSEAYDEDHLISEDETNEFDLPVDETSGQAEDSEELQNDSGFHHEPGKNRPDDAVGRDRRSAQEGDDDNDDEGIDESWEWDDSEEYGSDEYDDGYISDDEGDNEDYELPTYSSEESEFEDDDSAIDNGEFDDEEEIAEDEDGALRRLMHNTA